MTSRALHNLKKDDRTNKVINEEARWKGREDSEARRDRQGDRG